MKAAALYSVGALGICLLLALGASAANAPPPASGAPPSSDTAPDWKAIPYPAQPGCKGASLVDTRWRREGHVVLRCRVTAAGRVDNCTVMSEDPPGVGFGQVALGMTCSFRMKPKIVDGKPVDSEVTIPVQFALRK